MGPRRAIPQFPNVRRTASFGQLQEQPMSSTTSRSSTTSSSPISATFSNTPKTSSSNSVSSMASSPIVPDSPVFLASKRSLPGGLPDVAEDPYEPETFPDFIARDHSTGTTRHTFESSRSSSRMTGYGRSSEDFNYYTPSFENYDTKRKRSGEQNWTTFAKGVRSRLGSLSKRSSLTKRDDTSMDDYYARYTPAPSPKFPASRSASRSHSSRTSFDADGYEIPKTPTHIETILEDDQQDDDDQPVLFPALDRTAAGLQEQGFSEIERRPTPLLPSFFNDGDSVPKVQSPLHSPTIVPSTRPSQFEPLPTTIGSPTLPSPALSHQPSKSSVRRSGSGPSTGVSDVPAFPPMDRMTELAAKLGHEDFTISPEPYLPDNMSKDTYNQFISDWDRARSEFGKHLGRLETQYPPSSTFYKWTSEKWNCIEQDWREANDEFLRHLYESGQGSYPSPKEPAPIQKIANIEDPRMVHTESIMGPMSVESAKQPPSRGHSRSGSLFRRLTARTSNKRSISSGSFQI